MISLIRTFVTLGGIGYLPAGGTVASALTAVLYYFLHRWLPSERDQLIILLVVAIIATLLSHIAARSFGKKDPSQIVVDEFIGMWLALVFVPYSIASIIVIFLLFRVLDIYKPGLVGWADRKVTGGLGIMLDDVIAGSLCIPVSLALHFLPRPF